MKLAIVDIETTSADTSEAKIVEIACCLWSVNDRIVTSSFSTIVHASENPAEHVNGIPASALSDATTIDRALLSIGHFVAKADVVAAHNGDSFDRPILERQACSWVASKPWIDTMDMTWPRASSSRALIQIAAAHGVPIGTIHRAIDDVLLVARLFERAAELGADVNALIEEALRPRATFQALVSFDDREKAKEAGFRWDAPTKRWLRRMCGEDVGSLPFQAREVA